MIVLDASVVALAVGAEHDDARRVRDSFAGERLYAPELVDLEVASYIRRGRRAGSIGSQRAVQALAALALLPIARVSHTPFLSRIWELHDNLTPYDAAYVALAETMEARLLTVDARLARAPGIRCEVVLVS